MKIILTTILILILNINLLGRMDPFEPTDTFNEKKQTYYKQLETKKQIQQIKKTPQQENYKILPFVNIEVVDDILSIKIDKKYKLLNQDILKDENKLLFDFEGNLSFYTVRQQIKNRYFNSFAVGTHRKKNFFRVVVELSDDIIKYKEIVYNHKGIITIQKIKKQ